MATYSGQGIDIPVTASGDLNSVQFRFVTKGGADKNVIQATGASNPYPIGVLQNDPRDGETANVRIWGTSKVYVDAAASQLVYGGLVTCGSTGLAVPEGATSGSAPIVGMMLTSISSGSGVLGEILLLPMGVKVGAS